MIRLTSLIYAGLLAGSSAAPIAAQDRPDPRIRTVAVTDNVHMLIGNGGNIGVCVGPDGPFIIDDQYAPMVGQIKAAVGKLTDEPVRFVINTHWHGDHTGGNERFGKAGAVIVAHANVRKRMSVEQFLEAFGRKVPPSPKAALPVITFTEDVTLHTNGDDVKIFHVANAHTDGDSVVWFRKANVVHTGDVFFNGMYPFIDTSSGGSLAGMVAAADRILEITDAETKIIPGHGPLGNRAALLEYRDMLRTVHERVTALVKTGKTAAEVVAAKPTREWDATWGQGFLKADKWLGIVHASVTAELAAATENDR